MKKRFDWGVLVFLSMVIFGIGVARAERFGSLPPQPGTTTFRDASVTNIPNTYTTNSQLLSGLSNIQHVYVCTNQAQEIAVAFSSAANCVGASDYLIVPGGSTASCSPAIQYMKSDSKLCVRGLNNPISSGKVYVTVW